MSGPNRPARLNRGLLTLCGLLLLAGGAFTLARGLGLLPDLSATAPLVPSSAPPQAWVPFIAAAAATIVGLLCLHWLAAQALRRPKAGTWRLPSGPARGVTSLRTDTAATAIAEEIESYPGVNRTTASLAGSRQQPTLHLVVNADQHADITALRERIDDHALPRLRQALELDTLPADLLLRLDTNRSTTRIN
jgi:hypothetical protein